MFYLSKYMGIIVKVYVAGMTVLILNNQSRFYLGLYAIMTHKSL